MKQQKGLQAKDQQREVTAEARNLLNNKIACTNSFGGNNPSGSSGFTVTTIKDASAAPGVTRFAVNTNDKTGLLKFEEFRVRNFVVDPTNTTLGVADLEVKLSKVGDTGTVKEVKPDILALKIVRNASGNIVDCFSMGGKNEALWQVSTNLTDIYYNAGNVGIGLLNPIYPFNVGSAFEGNAFAVNSTGDIIVTGGADRLWGLYKTDLSGNPQGIININSNNSSVGISANVGIGTMSPTEKLEVNGGIKPGSTGITVGNGCGSEGTFAYDMGTHVPVYCSNIAKWTKMGGGVQFQSRLGSEIGIATGNTNISTLVGSNAIAVIVSHVQTVKNRHRKQVVWPK